MSWTQDYKFPNLFELFRKIAKDRNEETNYRDIDIISLAMDALPSIFGGISMIKIERIKVDADQFQDIYGLKITLSNGKVYKTVLKERFIDQKSGSYGCDYYEWKKVE